MTSTIGLGLLGAGRFGKTLAELSVTVPEFRLVAVCDIQQDNAHQVAAQYQATHCQTVNELLYHPQVDAVIIATSHDMHHPQTLAAAQAGKHIFCEKPMALNVVQCQAMIEATQRHGVKLLIGHVTRLFPSIQRIYQLIDDDILGRPLAMKILRSAWVVRQGWWATSAQNGGLMHSSGAHMYDLMESILGEATSIFAVSAPRIQHQLDYEDTMFSMLRYAEGGIGTVDVSISGEAWVYGGGLLAEKGTLHFQFTDKVSWIEYQLRGKSPIREAFGTFDQEGLDGVVVELQNFRNMILHDAKPFISTESAMRAVQIIQAAYESAQTGRVVQLPSNHEVSDKGHAD